MSKETPLIVGFVADLMSQSKIEVVARRLGYTMLWIERAEMLDSAEIKDSLGEPVSGGQTTELTQLLSIKQPHLLIVDLTNDQIPWQRWVPILRSSPATKRIPIIAFGPHVEKEMLETAHQVGVNGVVTRGKFVNTLPDLINKYARRHDYAAILSACESPLSALAVAGIELFNQGEFYEAHHGFEDAWNADKGPAREFYRAILQVAVAYLQIERGNYRGAVKMFLRVRQWLDPLPDVCHGVDVAQLREDAEAVHAAVLVLGSEGIGDFDRGGFRPIKFIPL